jgi:polyhydroxyalkanoate synthase
MVALQIERPVSRAPASITVPSLVRSAPSEPPRVSDERTVATGTVDGELAALVRTEIERAIQRNIKGLEYLSASDPQVGLSPKQVIHRRGTLALYHYLPTTPEVYRVPLLIVHSLVSKPYILDLTPGQSLIEFLVSRGFDVYLVDWGTPRPEDSQLTLERYVLDFLPECVERVAADSGEADVSLIGYCFGGVLALLYAALNSDGPLRNLVCFTTPVNFEGMGLQRRWSDPRWFDVDRVVDTLGNVPPDLLLRSFEMLRPASKPASLVLLWDKMWDDDFVKAFRLLDHWATDHIPFPGECFRQVIKELMWGNRLIQGTFTLRGRAVRLEDVRVPLLNVTAEYDHIVPAAASRELVPLVGSGDKQDLVLKGGHVSLVAGGNAVYRLWPKLDAWLAPRSV